MKMRSLLIAVLALVLVCSTVRAADYYISTTGNDVTGDGSLANPWASPSRGASARVNGAHAAGVGVVDVRDTEGFLASGNINITGVGTVAYTSKTSNSFTLAAPLPAAASDGWGLHDGDIMGGSGLQPGDNVILRGGTYSQNRLRLRNSGASGSPITYKAYAGEAPMLQIINLAINGTGVLWTDSEATQKTEYITIDGLAFQADQNGIGAEKSSAAILNGLNSTLITNSKFYASGSAGDSGYGMKAVKCSSLEISHSTFWSTNEAAFRPFIGGSYTLHHSVLGGNKYGIINNYSAVPLDMYNLTIIAIPNLNVHIEGDPGTWPTFIKDSIIVDSAALACNDGQGDYNNVWNNVTNYGANWDGPSTNDISQDPNFIVDDFVHWSDVNQSDPNWLRYDWSDAQATASSTGSWIGAFEPVPEPATLALLLISGLGAALLRRK